MSTSTAAGTQLMPERYSMGDMLRDAGAQPQHAEPFDQVILPYRPRPDQIDGLRKMVQWKRFGLFAEARCGKTVTFSVGCIYFAKYQYKSVILMPPVLFLQFKEFWDSIENNPASMLVLNQSKEKREALVAGYVGDLASAPDVLVMTSVIFKKHVVDLLKAGYRNLVFDESHQVLQSKDNATYAAVSRFVNFNPNYRLTLSTGTPIPNEVLGVFPTMTLLNPQAYAGKNHFCREHVIYENRLIGRSAYSKIVPVIVGYRNLDKVHANLYQFGHRVTKAEVLNLETPNIQIIPITLSSSHQALYKKLLAQKVLEVGDTLINAIQAQKLRQVALQLITTPEEFSDAPVHNVVVEAVEQVLSSVGIEQEKVVVFANFNRSVESLQAHLKKYNPAIVYGPGTNNAKEADRFVKDPSCRLLIANPQAGGVGLTLGGVSTTVMFVEPTSSPGAFDQAVSRVILAGQTKPVSVYIFKVLSTISPKAIDLMLRKAEEVKEANQDKKSLLDELLGNR